MKNVTWFCVAVILCLAAGCAQGPNLPDYKTPKLAEFDRLFEQSQQKQSADSSAPAAREAAAAGV